MLNKNYHVEVLLKRFHLNGYTIGGKKEGVKIVIHAIERDCVTPFAMFFNNLKRVFASIAFQK